MICGMKNSRIKKFLITVIREIKYLRKSEEKPRENAALKKV